MFFTLCDLACRCDREQYDEHEPVHDCGLVCTSGARNRAQRTRVYGSSVDATLRHKRCADATFSFDSGALTAPSLLLLGAGGAHFFL